MEQPLSFTNDLTKIGLSESEATVYETLIYKGERSASMLKRALPANISRPMLYFILDRLVEIGLVIKKEVKGKPASFAAEHPKKLENIILRKQEELEKTKAQFDTVIGGITSSYNLQIGKPYIEFREGLDGAAKIMDDTLSSNEVFTIVDTDMLERYAAEIDRKYVAKRKQKMVRKKILMFDSPLARQNMKEMRELTEIRLLPKNTDVHSFASTINIYDGKVAYFTFKENLITATLIHNQEIYELNHALFVSLWNNAIKDD